MLLGQAGFTLLQIFSGVVILSKDLQLPHLTYCISRAIVFDSSCYFRFTVEIH